MIEKPTIPVPPQSMRQTVDEGQAQANVAPALGEHTAVEARAAHDASHTKRTPKPKTRLCVCGCGATIPIAREFAPGHLKALHSRVKTMIVQSRMFKTPIDLPDMALRYATNRGWLILDHTNNVLGDS